MGVNNTQLFEQANTKTQICRITLGQWLKDYRNIKRLWQAELAMRAGHTLAAIAKLEAGSANPTILTLKKLAKAMDRQLLMNFSGRIRRQRPTYFN